MYPWYVVLDTRLAAQVEAAPALGRVYSVHRRGDTARVAWQRAGQPWLRIIPLRTRRRVGEIVPFGDLLAAVAAYSTAVWVMARPGDWGGYAVEIVSSGGDTLFREGYNLATQAQQVATTLAEVARASGFQVDLTCWGLADASGLTSAEVSHGAYT